MKKRWIICLCISILCGCQNQSSKKVEKADVDSGYVQEGNQLIIMKNEKYGVMDTEQTIVIPCEYDLLARLDDYYIVKKKDQYGVLDQTNKEVLPIRYERILYDKEAEMLFASYKGQSDVFDIYGKQVGSLNGTLVKMAWETPMAFLEDEKGMRLYDAQGRQLSAAIYDCSKGSGFLKIESMEDRKIAICYKKGKAGLVDDQGKERCEFLYDDIRAIYDRSQGGIFSGYYQANKDGKGGIIDMNGNIILPFIYDPYTIDENGTIINGYEYHKGSGFTVCQDGKYGIITVSGSPLIACIARRNDDGDTGIDQMRDGCFCVRTGKETRVYDRYGKLKFKVSGSAVGFTERQIVVKNETDYTILDEQGKTLFQAGEGASITTRGSRFQYCKIDTSYNSSCGIIDEHGKEIIAMKQDVNYLYMKQGKHEILIRQSSTLKKSEEVPTVFDLNGKKRFTFHGQTSGMGYFYENCSAFVAVEGEGKARRVGLYSMDGSHKTEIKYTQISEKGDYYVARNPDDSCDMLDKATLEVLMTTKKGIRIVL